MVAGIASTTNPKNQRLAIGGSPNGRFFSTCLAEFGVLKIAGVLRGQDT